MDAINIEVDKCYKIQYPHGIQLFKVSSIEAPISITERLNTKITKCIEISPIDISIAMSSMLLIPADTNVEEIDESLLDKTIKLFNMNRTAILATINQESNET